MSFASGCPSKCIWIKRQSSTRGARCPKPWVADQPRQPSRWELRDKVSLQMTSALRGGLEAFLRTSPIWSYISTDLRIEFEQSSCWVRVLEKEAPLASYVWFQVLWPNGRPVRRLSLGAWGVQGYFTYTPPFSMVSWKIIIDWRLISISISWYLPRVLRTRVLGTRQRSLSTHRSY